MSSLRTSAGNANHDMQYRQRVSPKSVFSPSGFEPMYTRGAGWIGQVLPHYASIARDFSLAYLSIAQLLSTKRNLEMNCAQPNKNEGKQFEYEMKPVCLLMSRVFIGSKKVFE